MTPQADLHHDTRPHALGAGGAPTDADQPADAGKGSSPDDIDDEADPHTDRQLDKGLKETFPASDPVSINPGAD